MPVFVAPPASEAELVSRAEQLAGEPLGVLAARVGWEAPADLRRHKGFTGQLMERLLGATGGSRAVADFPELGVELKTLPVDARGVPSESTFVTSIPLGEIGDVEFEQSRVVRKLSRVLWVPVEGTRSLPVAERRVGTPLIWSPSAEELSVLRSDWESLCLLIAQGQVESVTGHLGRYLQVRPKARDGSARRVAYDEDGARLLANPRGFYLRARFTQQILARHFRLG
ncbi:MAG: DNA mismatch repair endonuclease MutH [Polyangiaceae bacterium]|nr:DNA mismatch repair endonuclease MutH [Polyangiaceae bacterium]